MHFLSLGGLEGRQPHPDFDSAFYLANNPDVVAKGLNPLVHFLEHGAAEGRLPHRDFDPAFYLRTHPDVVAANLDPILHFARHGAAEGRLTHPIRETYSPPEFFLPVSDKLWRRAPRQIDVVIPVYKGITETKACIESVLSNLCTAHFCVIVINDCSPEPELREYLRYLAREKKITLVENSENLGFIRSVNIGMQASDHDVVLLNSDTIVFDGWLDRLAACAYTDERTGTVTPFSNNATICSYPVLCSNNELSSSADLAALDSTFASVNCGRAIEIPTAVGFCMFIRRQCLQETGLFDAETFGLGYCEENDFCIKAAGKGWKHKLACDVFVYHAGSVSFGKGSARQQAAMEILLGKYPRYPDLVQQHIQMDPANAYRIAVTAQRVRNSGRRVFLSVVHTVDGSVTRHVRELAQLTGDEVIWLNLRSCPPDRVVLECAREGYQFSLTLKPRVEYKHLSTILRACGVERIHIHHLMQNVLDLPRLVEELGLPFDFTVHDYYTICPQVTLSDEYGRYCGEPGQTGCDNCLIRRPSGGNLVDISSWRANHAWALRTADRVIAPSADTAARIKRYYPEARIIAAEHEDSRFSRGVVPKHLKHDEYLRIAVPGTIATYDGSSLLEECIEAASRSQSPLEFFLVGSTEPKLRRYPVAFSETGPHEATELPVILERVAPHLVWFPTLWPETFSYGLTTCLELGLPAAAHDIGAFPERVAGRPWTWVVPREWSAAEWIDFFQRVRRDHFLTGTSPSAPPHRPRGLPDFYRAQYLSKESISSVNRSAMRSRSPKPITIAAAVATDDNGQITACGYVRVIRPLTHPAVADTLRLTVMTPRELATAEADVILVQRVAIQNMETAERLIQSCRTRGSQLVFEIDDNLFDISSEHPEYEQYVRATQAARWLARSADAIVTSTETLRERMLVFNPNAVVLPNYLDDRLWNPPSGPRQYHVGQVRILYAGTTSHRDDLEFLGHAVRNLGPGRVQIEVIGATSSAGDEWFQTIHVPHRIAASYPRFVEWLQSQNRWHWGVAPLLDTPFNRSKSAIKFLEYAGLGLPSICSEGPVYGGAVKHEETGLLAANDPASWRQALERAVTDAELWGRLREKCQTTVCENTISARAQTIKSAWESLIKGHSMKVGA